MKDKYILAIVLLSITLGFVFITGLIYIQKTKHIKKIKFEAKQDVRILAINDLYEQYELITDGGTFNVSKEYHSDLDRKAIEEIDLSKNFNIVYASTELVSLKNGSQKIFDIDLVQTKKEALNAIVTEVFYFWMAICICLIASFFIVPPLTQRTIKKVEENILALPNTTKIEDQLFHYSYRNIEFILVHILTTKRNEIRVYIPTTAEGLPKPIKLHTEGRNNQVYCYFDYDLYWNKVTAKKLQAKIDSKFITTA